MAASKPETGTDKLGRRVSGTGHADCRVLSGYTLGGADMLRRAMGKKKPEEMLSSVLYLLKVQKRTESTPNWR